MDQRLIGRSGLKVSPIGFGAFKIGRNVGTKYAEAYALPDEAAVARLIDGLADLGVSYIDTAPAYGVSEERLGRALAGRAASFVVSTKVGETFGAGRSSYDFSAEAIEASVLRSRERLRRDVLDLVFVHSDGRDLEILDAGEASGALADLKQRGLVRAIGFSGKTVEGARAALTWADAIMVEYHLEDRTHETVLEQAAATGVGVIVKKGLGSGRLEPAAAIGFVLDRPEVSSLVVGSLDLGHMRRNVELAGRLSGDARG